MSVLRVASLAMLLVGCFCSLGVDVSQLFPTSTFTCLKNAGYSFAVIRAYCSFGGIDKNAVQSLSNARGAGVATDVYMFPCRGKGGSAQVDEMFAGVNPALYGTVWIDVETNPSAGCSWSGHDGASNCAFLTEIANRIVAKGKRAGIYASKVQWQSILGSATACPALASHELWYAHYDNNPSFSDFAAFGGWTKPSAKQFQGDVTLCGAGVDKNYKP